MTEESLYFTSIESTEISSEINEPEYDVSIIETKTEEEQVRIVKEIDSDDQSPKVQISNQKSDKPKRELPKSSTIGSMFKEIHKEVVAVQDDHKVELTEENVLLIWRTFLTEHKDKLQNAFLSAAQSQLPKLIEDKVTFTAGNNVSLEMLQLHKMDITAYFRKKTTSGTVVPDFILQRDESQVKNYKTAKDRLKDMIDSNAAVLKLIEKFDLNID